MIEIQKLNDENDKLNAENNELIYAEEKLLQAKKMMEEVEIIKEKVKREKCIINQEKKMCEFENRKYKRMRDESQVKYDEYDSLVNNLNNYISIEGDKLVADKKESLEKEYKKKFAVMKYHLYISILIVIVLLGVILMNNNW